MLFASIVLDGKDIGLHDHKPPPRFDHRAACNQRLSHGGRYQVDLDFRRDNLVLGRHACQRRKPGSRIAKGKDKRRMTKALLLAKVFVNRCTNLNLSVGNLCEPRADGGHKTLRSKALVDLLNYF